MDMTSYVDKLGRELTALLDAGGDEARAAVERLSSSLDSAIRLTLLDALSGAADEITRDLAPGSVELRLRGRDPNFVVTPPPVDQPAGVDHDDASSYAMMAPSDASVAGTEDGATARINFRLPEQLKTAIEEAAGRQGRSVNAWLTQVASAALRSPDGATSPRLPGKRGSQRYTGWVR